MKLRRRDRITVNFVERIPLKDDDGTTYEGWSNEHLKITGNVQPAGGKVMAEQYGERLNSMLIMYADRTVVTEKMLHAHNGEQKAYGAYLYVPKTANKPDYKVVAIKGWQHIVIELEKV